MWTPRLVAVDLDGTVVPHGDMHAAAGAATVRALAAVRAAGVPVVVVTARSPWDSARAMAALGLGTGGPHVYLEGALLTGAGGRVTHRAEIDAEAVIDGYRDAAPGAAFSLEDAGSRWLLCPDFGQSEYWASPGAVTRPLAELKAARTTAIGVRVPCDGTYRPADVCSHAAVAVARTGLDPAAYRAHVGRYGWVSVVDGGTDKATGLARVAAGLGIAAGDVVAFGDSRNDLPMLDWAGLGVAMGQAPDVVRAAADEVAPEVADEGVARVLERWFRE